jgi:hypothetical protein
VLHLPAKTSDFSLGTCNLILQLSVLTLQLTGSRFESIPAEACAAAVAGHCGTGLDWEVDITRASAITAAVVLLQLQLPRAQSFLRMIWMR